jgi:gas vesicle protein
MNNKLLTFLAGAGAGVVAGLLLAPRSGEEVRGAISDKFREGYDNVSQRVQEQGGIRGIVEKGVTAGKNAIETSRQRLNETIERSRSHLNESFEAGKSEYWRQREPD